MSYESQKSAFYKTDVYEEEQAQPKQTTAHIFLICLMLFGIPAGVCIYQQDFVTGIALATIGLSCYLGYRTGAVRALASVGGIIAAVLFAPKWLPSVEPVLAEWFSLSGLLNRGVSLGLIGLAIIIVCALIGRLVSRLFFSKRGSVSGLNRWGGLLMMGGEAVVGIALLLGGLLIVSPEKEEAAVVATSDEETPLTLNDQMDIVAAQTRSGAIGRVLEQHNPFVKFPQLNKFKEIEQAVRTVSDPAAMMLVVSHPRIEELKDNPAVEAAIANFKADEELNEIFQSGESLDREKMMVLLKSDAVMDLLDEPAFVEEASSIIEELNYSEPVSE